MAKPLRLLLVCCWLRCASSAQQPADHSAFAGLTCSDLRSELLRSEAELFALQQRVVRLKNEHGQISESLHRCAAQSPNGSTSALIASGKSDHRAILADVARSASRAAWQQTAGHWDTKSARLRKITPAGKNRWNTESEASEAPAAECRVLSARYGESRGRLLHHISASQRLRHAENDFLRRIFRILGDG
jgi:hypothetical protein